MSRNDYPATSCLALILAVLIVLPLATVFWFLLINWVLSVFNIAYTLTWSQSLAVAVCTGVVRNMLKSSK